MGIDYSTQVRVYTTYLPQTFMPRYFIVTYTSVCNYNLYAVHSTLYTNDVYVDTDYKVFM